MRLIRELDVGGETNRSRPTLDFRKNGRVKIDGLLALLGNESSLSAKYRARRGPITVEKTIPLSGVDLKMKIRVLDLGDRKEVRFVERLVRTSDRTPLILYRFNGSAAVAPADD